MDQTGVGLSQITKESRASRLRRVFPFLGNQIGFTEWRRPLKADVSWRKFCKTACEFRLGLQTSNQLREKWHEWTIPWKTSSWLWPSGSPNDGSELFLNYSRGRVFSVPAKKAEPCRLGAEKMGVRYRDLRYFSCGKSIPDFFGWSSRIFWNPMITTALNELRCGKATSQRWNYA